MRRLAAALVLAVGLFSVGCGRAGAKVQTGIDYYEHGAYEGALIKFRTIDAEESSLRTKTHARYLVYRGLTHWHLEQNDEARRYLNAARKALADGGDPKWVPSDVREELAKAERELGLGEPTLPGKPGAAPAGSGPADKSPPGTPPGPPDGSPVPPADKPPTDGGAQPSPSSPTSSPPGAAPGSSLPPSTTPAPEPL